MKTREDFHRFIAEQTAAREALAATILAEIDAGRGYKASNGLRMVIITKSTSEPGMLQITNFYEGEATGHINSSRDNIGMDARSMMGAGFVQIKKETTC